MEALQSFKRKREMRKAKRAAGVKAGRGGRRASGGCLVVSDKEHASVHQLMAEDAQSNLRVWQMWDEACDFEGELDHFRNNLTKFENATDEFVKRIEPILRAPLPRVWDAVEGGLAEPTRATISHGHQHTVGGDVSIAGLEEARSEYHNRLRGHIIRPLHQWSEALGVVEERLPELKQLRQQVIKASKSTAKSSRQFKAQAGDEQEAGHAAAGALVPFRGNHAGGMRSMFGACGRPQVGPSPGGGSSVRTSRRQLRNEQHIEDDYYSSSSSDEEHGRASGAYETGVDRVTRREIQMEEAGMRLNYKHRQLLAARADYADCEKLVAGQLTGLQRDAAWTKSYVVAALLLTKECLQTAVVSMGNTKQPLPGFQGRGTVAAVGHGHLRDNVNLAAGMPEDMNLEVYEAHLQSGQSLKAFRRDTPALPSLVHAHKATAAPMELHARPDVSALDRVNTPPTGAAAIPVAALEGLHLQESTGAETTHQVGSMTQGGGSASEAYDAISPRSIPSSTHAGRASDASWGVLEQGGDEPKSPGFTGGVSHAMTSMGGAQDRRRSNVTSGAADGTAALSLGGSSLHQRQTEHVCSSKTFTQVEDRPVTKERVETILEHRPVEKQYVTELRYVGEVALPASKEHVDSTTRTVATATPGPKSPSGPAGTAPPRAAVTDHHAASSSRSSSSDMDGDVQGGPMGGSRMQDQTGLSSTHIQGTASTESQGVGGATAGGGSGKRELSGGFITAAPAGVQDVMGRRE